MSHDRRYVIILIVAGIISAASGILGNIAANALPDSLKPYLWLAWPLFAAFMIAGIGLAIYQARLDRKGDAAAPPADPQATKSTSFQQSGGVEIRGNTIIIYGDVAGRDKTAADQAAVAPSFQEASEHPPPGIWYLAHPYAMPANFTGRVAEKAMLALWLNADRDHPLFVLRALGGFGKSALAWHWLTREVDASQWWNVMWWSFYEGDASFENFLREALKSLKIDPPPGPRQQVDALLQVLQRPGTLLILDGFERQLRAFSGMNAAYQGDEAPTPTLPRSAGEGGSDRDCISLFAEHFLRGLAALPNLRGKVLMTTRLRPRILEVRGGLLLGGCREEELKQMQPADAVDFFRAQGVRGSRAEIEAACAPYGYHPLSLRLLAGLIVGDLQQPGDIAAARRLDVGGDLVQRQHHVLEQAYASLTPARQKLLSRIACFRGAVSYEALQKTCEVSETSQVFEADLRDLLARGLLHRDEKTNRFDLHPIVRRYAYDRLTAHDRSAAHAQLRDYFAAVPTPDKVQTLDDLMPVIELYHHTVRAGRYDEAFGLMSGRIGDPIYYQFGAYQFYADLLRALFPDGEDRPPRLKSKRDQSWAANALANSYSLSGQPGRAVPLFLVAASLDESEGDKKNLATSLGNVADDQLKIGALKAAEANLRRSIKLSQETEDQEDESWGRYELGRVLAYLGHWSDSAQELDAGEAIKKRTGHVQAQGVIWASRALRALLMARDKTSEVSETSEVYAAALSAARRALELADETARTLYPHERDYVRAHWLLGAAQRLNSNLTEAERHLSEALTRCRKINAVDAEADILLDLARLWADQDERKDALRLAQEALLIAERSGYVLQGADVHLFLAQMALKAGDKAEALVHAREARRLATCDGPPDYTYKVAYDEAGALLRELGGSAE